MEHLSELFRKTNYTRRTHAVDSLLEELDKWWRLSFSSDTDVKDTYGQIQILRVELRFCKMLLMCLENRACFGVPLWSLVQDLEAAFKEARMDFRIASEKGIERRADYLDPAISKWQKKFALFGPLIKAAYDYVLSNNNSTCPPSLSNYTLWNDFAYCLLHNLEVLSCTESTLIHSIIPQLHTMEKMLRSLRSFLHTIQDVGPKEHDYIHLLSHFGAVLARAAHVSYMCWVGRLDDTMIQEMTIKLLDLLKKLKPDTPQVTEMSLKLLKALYFSNYRKLSKDYWVKTYVRFLIPEKDRPRTTLRKEVEYLITLVIHPPDFYKYDDVRLLLMDITEMTSQLGSLSYLFHAKETIIGKETSYPALLNLLEKMELLNAELFLMELMELLPSRISKESFVRNRIDSFNDGLSFLQTFLGDGNNNIPKPNWTNVGSLAKDAGYVYLAFLANSVTIDKAQDQLLKFFEKIKLFKMEMLLEEFLNSHPILMVNVKNQTQILYDGLKVLRTFLMGPSEENGKLILPYVESVVRDIASVYCSFHANDVTEGKATSIVLLLHELVQRIEPVTAEIKKIYLSIRSSSKSNFPKTSGFGFMDFLLGNLRELLNSKADSIASLKCQIQAVYGEIEFLRSLLWDIEGQRTEHFDLKNLVSHIIQVAYEVEYLVDSLVVVDGVLWYHGLWIFDVIADIKFIKSKASEISTRAHGISILNDYQASKTVLSSAKIPKIDEALVDLADQNKLIIDRLTRGSLKRDVVSIVGMPGLGKTTLARKVYHDPSVTYHFHIRAWCCVSQVYCRRDLLLEILGDIVDLTDNILEMNDDDLDLELYRCLKGKSYLIVMDDMWSIEAWNDLERTFPDDGNGSRILITSRLPDLALEVKADSIPHRLRLLSDDESWRMLQQKLFQKKDCPVELVAVGKQIAKSCNGLPLAVVAISGLLERTDMKPDWWKQVAETLCSRIVDDPQTRCMDILELSYKHLPDYLKACFLYLGSFMQNKEIPVRKLTRLLVAERFIQTTRLECAEEVAEEYLRDLIGRSLVIASKRRSDGGVKTCRVHDMLRALCLLKCKEESFLQCISGYDELFAASPEDSDYGVDPNYCYPTNWVTYEKRRLSICSKRNHFVMSRPRGPQVRSLLYSASSDLYPRCPYDISFIADNFKLLRILDLECINMGNSFPDAIELLVHLRYLSLCGDIDCIPASISKLWNLEMLIVKGLKGKVLLPDAIWSMAKLRHVHVSNNAVFSSLPDSDQEDEEKDDFKLENLVSLSSPSLSCGENTECILRRLPNLRKLRCLFAESRIGDAGNCSQFPALGLLTELESLKVVYSGRIAHPRRFDFPLTLKKLTLSRFRLPWDCVSEIGRLPNLEVLKLLSRAFEGKVWDMKEGEFLNLKFLKLDNLNVARWNASGDNLPNLQHLVLRSCRLLEEVPCGFADITTLETIEVQLCRRSAEESVKRLKEEQLDMGNEELQVFINRSGWDF